MHRGFAVGTELDPAGLGLANRLGHVIAVNDRPGSRIGHQPARAEHATQPTDLAHQLALRHGDVEVGQPVLHLLNQVVRADDLGPCLGRRRRRVAFGKDGHADFLAQPMRESGCASQLLIGMANVESGANMQLDRLIELGGRHLLDQRHRFGGQIVRFLAVRLDRAAVALAMLGHR